MKTKVLIVVLLSLIAISTISTRIGIAANDRAAGLERVPVLIGFNRVPGPSEQALVRGHGALIKYSYHLVPAIAASIPEPAIQGLLRNPNVTRIDPDIKVYAIDAELDNSWGVKRIGAGTVHDGGNKGTGIKVAIIDSGIDYTHEDLDGRYAGGYDFVNDDTDPMDDAGHGTHVAGTVAAEDNGVGVVGVAPEALIYGLKVLGPDGSGDYSDVIAALQWAVDNGMEVTNNSYGSSGDPGPSVKAAFDNAAAAGILHVCAAGNSGNPRGRGDNVIYPARYASCIAVAATDKSDKRARFSSTGPDVGVAAPGVSINSTLLGGGYGTKSGTSMASPHVAGTAALVLVAYPSWTNAQVRAQLQGTADDLGDPGLDPEYGYGLVDADEAAGGPEEPVTDVAIMVLDAPTSVVQGDVEDVYVTLENVGNQDVTGNINVTLASNLDGFIDTQTIMGLAAGASETLTLTWDTSEASLAEHTLTASHDFADDNGSNDSLSATVTVTEPGTEPTMHVASIEMSLSTRKAGRNTFTNALATVTILDASNKPVQGATVYASWSGATSDSDSGLTDTQGKVTLESDAVKNASSGTTFTFTVDNVVKSGWTYDPASNIESSDFIVVP